MRDILLSKIMNIFKNKNEKKEEIGEMENNHKKSELLSVENNIWGPTIDYDRCKNCTSCYKVCDYGVYAVENGKVIVKNKSNCVKGCFKCLSVCRYGAISFPND